MKSKKKHSVRLPKHVVPERYRLMLRPDLERFTFFGEETIYLTVRTATREIILHSKELDVESAKFKVQSAEWEAKITYDEKAETVALRFDKTIPKGKGELRILFRGLLNDKMRGFYRSKYIHGKKEKYMATTQFEATDARRAFPCFDEPAHKAVFDVTLQIPGHTTAISNTLETAIEEHEGGYKVVQFAPTPKMSTYLLAFIVGEFEYIEGKTKDNVLVRIFVTPGKKHQATFALETAIKALEFYNDYFKIPYPLPVLDLIAIPDFTSAAMENWGAVTYRESALLVDPEKTSAASKQWVAIVIAHELAHQWFGNLVTMEWWTDLWLNEGFASYMEYLTVDALFPQWDMWTQYVSGRLSQAMELDALKNTHPIEVEVHHPNEISEIFDMVSYAKGSSVIRMLAAYLGEKDFRDGLRYYLKKHSYSNAKTSDLWRAFEHVSKKPVRKIMEQWIRSSGYPLIKITEKTKGLELAQSRYFSSSLSRKTGKDKTLWHIPVSYITSKDKRPKHVLLTGRTRMLPSLKAAWVKLNAGETSLVRTDYPAQMLQALKPAIQKKQLPASDRLGIVRDAFALAESLELPTVQALQLAESYTDEDDYTVWSELATGIGTVGILIHGEKYYPQFEAYARELFRPVTARLGWQAKKGEKHTTGLLRNLILSSSAYFGNRDVIEHARKLFTSGKPISSDIRGVVYTTVARHGSMKEFNILLKRYKAEQLHEEKDRIARALAVFQDKAAIRKMLEFTVSEDVRFQDTPFYLGAVLRNFAGRDLAWAFIKKNWKVFLKRYDAAMSMLDRILTPAGNYATEAFAKEFESFFKTHPAPGASRTIQQTLERIRSNAAWLNQEGDNIERWLKSR